MNRTIQVASHHTMYIESIPQEELAGYLFHLSSETKEFNKFYIVRNWDKNGPIFMYLGKGHKQAPNQVCVWYRKTGSMWTGFGNNFKQAIEGAQRDGWLYA